MVITKIELVKGNRFKVYGNDVFLFALYMNELKKYHIIENIQIDSGIIDCIKEDVILKRAKNRALYILEHRPYTKQMMIRKLEESYYPEEIINRVVLFLEQYGYLDDRSYFHMYLEAHLLKKSKKQIIYDLILKGVDKNLINEEFEKCLYTENDSCKRQFDRYIRGKDLTDKKVREKTFAYLYRKGFSSRSIKEVVESIEIVDG